MDKYRGYLANALVAAIGLQIAGKPIVAARLAADKALGVAILQCRQILLDTFWPHHGMSTRRNAAVGCVPRPKQRWERYWPLARALLWLYATKARWKRYIVDPAHRSDAVIGGRKTAKVKATARLAV